MSFADLLAELDATAFAELADDVAAVWTRAGGVSYTVSAMLEDGEQQALTGGMPVFASTTRIRLSAAEVAARAPDMRLLSQLEVAEQYPEFAEVWPPPLPRPVAGDKITIRGVAYILHGDPHLDDAMGGRDWICPASKL